MPTQPFSLAKPNLAYAKLAATPTDASWSQVYNAGSLFACISLSQEDKTENSLQAIGKEISNHLEAEFFTLEDKNLASIKEAMQKSIRHAPSSVAVYMCLAYFKNTILYVFIAGAGKVIMKRGGKIGVLLERKEGKDNDILTASGYLHNQDTIILETKQFAEDIPDETIISALELTLPNDIAEALSPQIHEKDDGGQAAIIITYQGVTKKTLREEEEETIAEKAAEEEAESPKDTDSPEGKKTRLHLPHLPSFTSILPGIRLPLFTLNRRKRIFLSIVLIIISLLAVSIFFAKNKQEDTQTRQLFQSVYEPAQKSYEEGKALASLNKSVSRTDFLKAEKILKENQGKFQKGSPEEKQINVLLRKVEAELAATNASNKTPIKETSVGSHDLLAVAQEEINTLGFGQDADSVYVLTDKAVIAVNKATGNKKEIIANNDDWKDARAVIPYQGNIYILDRKNGVLKYTAGSSGFGKTAYFSSQTPDLTKASAMAIDGSVWILFSDGAIQKYTRGVADTFTFSGLEKPFTNPAKIFTDINTDNVYVLDNGNARIVKLAKAGAFQTEYSADILQQAKDFEVKESEKKIVFLANNKVWEIALE